MTKDLSYFRILLRKGDTPAGTVTGTEFDEVRGGLRSELSRRAGVDEVMAVLELLGTVRKQTNRVLECEFRGFPARR